MCVWVVGVGGHVTSFTLQCTGLQCWDIIMTIPYIYLAPFIQKAKELYKLHA